jgi:hypothetical protein
MKCIEPYKILFPCTERLYYGENIVFAYVSLDPGFGLSTLISSIAYNDSIKFKLNIIYITNHSRMLESSDVICLIPADKTMAKVIYQFSTIKQIGNQLLVNTYESNDNLELPDYIYNENNEPKIINSYYLELENNLLYSENNLQFPNLFTIIYKAFDTKDNDLLQECCNVFSQILHENEKYKNENHNLKLELEKLQNNNEKQYKILSKIFNQINDVMQSNN